MRPVVEQMKQALHVGVAQPSLAPVVLQASPQRGMLVERIVISSARLESWQVDLIAVGGKPVFEGCWPVPAVSFSAGSFGRTAFRLPVGLLVEIGLTWLGPLPRFPWYRHLWAWVRRNPLPTVDARVLLFGSPGPSEVDRLRSHPAHPLNK